MINGTKHKAVDERIEVIDLAIPPNSSPILYVTHAHKNVRKTTVNRRHRNICCENTCLSPINIGFVKYQLRYSVIENNIIINKACSLLDF
jgi:hypothetical protein